MPSLQQLLDQTMFFTALRGRGVTPIALDGEFHSPDPKPRRAGRDGELDEVTVRNNAIWRFRWDPAEPGTVRDVTIRSRGMGMDYGMPSKVYERVEFRGLKVERPGESIDLLLDPAHMLGAWWSPTGLVPASRKGLWQLEARTDASILVAFGYQLDGGVAQPLSLAECEALGDALVPVPGMLPPLLDFIAGDNTAARVCVGSLRFVVAVELVLCREANDFVPAGLIGFARIHPHVMIWSNDDNARIEGTIVLARPPEGMSHDESIMGKRFKPLLVTDTNEAHGFTSWVGMPLPFSDNLYDYYETEPVTRFRGRAPGPNEHPLARTGEFTFADPRFTQERRIEGVIERRSFWVRDHLPKAPKPDILRQPRQGMFDNVHIAPRMRLLVDGDPDPVVIDDNLPMLNMCLHDCTHLHVRWPAFLNNEDSDRMTFGWADGRPFACAGAPAVPENQTVFGSLPDEHTLRYRASAQSCPAGKATVLCHHGVGYAVDVWPGLRARSKIKLLRTMIRDSALHDDPATPGADVDDWVLFYFQVMYIGQGGQWVRRSGFDLEECLQ